MSAGNLADCIKASQQGGYHKFARTHLDEDFSSNIKFLDKKFIADALVLIGRRVTDSNRIGESVSWTQIDIFVGNFKEKLWSKVGEHTRPDKCSAPSEFELKSNQLTFNHKKKPIQLKDEYKADYACRLELTRCEKDIEDLPNLKDLIENKQFTFFQSPIDISPSEINDEAADSVVLIGNQIIYGVTKSDSWRLALGMGDDALLKNIKEPRLFLDPEGHVHINDGDKEVRAVFLGSVDDTESDLVKKPLLSPGFKVALFLVALGISASLIAYKKGWHLKLFSPTPTMVYR